jgi:hypothetical protein
MTCWSLWLCQHKRKGTPHIDAVAQKGHSKWQLPLPNWKFPNFIFPNQIFQISWLAKPRLSHTHAVKFVYIEVNTPYPHILAYLPFTSVSSHCLFCHWVSEQSSHLASFATMTPKARNTIFDTYHGRAKRNLPEAPTFSPRTGHCHMLARLNQQSSTGEQAWKPS